MRQHAAIFDIAIQVCEFTAQSLEILPSDFTERQFLSKRIYRRCDFGRVPVAQAPRLHFLHYRMAGPRSLQFAVLSAFKSNGNVNWCKWPKNRHAIARNDFNRLRQARQAKSAASHGAGSRVMSGCQHPSYNAHRATYLKKNRSFESATVVTVNPSGGRRGYQRLAAVAQPLGQRVRSSATAIISGLLTGHVTSQNRVSFRFSIPDRSKSRESSVGYMQGAVQV